MAPILDARRSAEHPHNQARKTFTDAVGGVVPQPAPRLSRTPGVARLTAPLPGEHTAQVLGDAGIAASEIERMKRDGIVG